MVVGFVIGGFRSQNSVVRVWPHYGGLERAAAWMRLAWGKVAEGDDDRMGVLWAPLVNGPRLGSNLLVFG